MDNEVRKKMNEREVFTIEKTNRLCKKAGFGSISRSDEPKARSVLAVREDLRRRTTKRVGQRRTFYTV